MVWAYLTGLNNAEETQKEFRHVNYVFGSPQFGQYTAPIPPTESAYLKKNEKAKAAAKLKEANKAKVTKARQDARHMVNGRVSSRVRQLRKKAEEKTQE